MYNLVKPFNYDATKNRIKPQMQKCYAPPPLKFFRL